MMTIADLLPLLPLLIVAAAILVTLLVVAVRRAHRLAAGLTLVGLSLAFVALPVAARYAAHLVTPLFIVDGLGLSLMGLVIAAAFVVTLFSYRYLEQLATQREEYYILLLIAVLGALVLAVSRHFAAFFLGLEILGVSLYGLIAYQPELERNIEAGFKYFTLAALSTAFVAFGIALIYAATGSLAFAALSRVATSGGVIALAGIALLLVGIGFKLALVPFHMWSPEIYQGAPAPVSGFIATISKGAVFVFLLRLVAALAQPLAQPVFYLLGLIAVVSMFVGNLLALQQNNLKRLLGYSSIAQIGYLLITVLAIGAWAPTAAIFFLLAYFASMLTLFGVISLRSGPEGEAELIEDYRGLFWRRPWLSLVLTISLLSLAGIPFTAGFFAKFLLLAGGVSVSYWLVIFSLVLSSVIGLYYYLRVIVALFAPLSGAETPAPAVNLWAGWVPLATLTVLLLWGGTLPASLLDLIEAILRVGR